MLFYNEKKIKVKLMRFLLKYTLSKTRDFFFSFLFRIVLLSATSIAITHLLAN